MVKDVVLLSIIGVLIFIPHKVERIGVIAAITSCKNNDGLQSIKRVIGKSVLDYKIFLTSDYPAR